MSEFGERPLKTLDEMDRISIEEIGITFDYQNELRNPDIDSAVDGFIENCLNGKTKTYSERFANQPELISASDPDKVAKIDQLMSEAREAGRAGDRDRVKTKLREIYKFFEIKGESSS